jgi:hypothetical protein
MTTNEFRSAIEYLHSDGGYEACFFLLDGGWQVLSVLPRLPVPSDGLIAVESKTARGAVQLVPISKIALIEAFKK